MPKKDICLLLFKWWTIVFGQVLFYWMDNLYLCRSWRRNCRFEKALRKLYEDLTFISSVALPLQWWTFQQISCTFLSAPKQLSIFSLIMSRSTFLFDFGHTLETVQFNHPTLVPCAIYVYRISWLWWIIEPNMEMHY